MNDATRRAHALLARCNELLAARPRFSVDAWAARSPDVDDVVALRAWLAELPDEPAPETDYARRNREWREEAEREAETRKKAREERARKRREALAAALREPARNSATAPAWAESRTAIIRKVIFTRSPRDSDG